ncbi:TIGR00725 family protein [Cellulomonas alba]|uniref:TIGR00725 family protein n=1 Tax=Cellulomonas alba TaxID=3053467 RepID=A0ABT7SG35_9CELL|nr:TIGR00725 family protein [Cellulomonas alba]MDM7855147.1 TIGR00725 family protein [Cellulomonas alba]
MTRAAEDRGGATGAAYVAVVGPGDATEAETDVAHRLGHLLASAGHMLLCGGLGGVMAAVARGAADAGGVVVGLLPGTDRHAGAPHLTVALATGLGEMRNALLVRAADVVVAVGGSWGTLSEVALAVRTGVPVVAIGGWTVTTPDGGHAPGVHHVADAAEAAVAVGRLVARR